MLEYTNKYILLNHGDVVKLNDTYEIYSNKIKIEKNINTFNFKYTSREKGNFDLFMLKEILFEELVSLLLDSYFGNEEYLYGYIWPSVLPEPVKILTIKEPLKFISGIRISIRWYNMSNKRWFN